jgi:phosphogluconate dehydratase
MTHKKLLEITDRLSKRSQSSRGSYLEMLSAANRQRPNRSTMSCANLAHAYAGFSPTEKLRVASVPPENLAVVTAYNDMLSAHKPYEHYPAIIRREAARLGVTAQVAGGVPAMCDGVTQGYEGMELSLFSRDVITLSTAVALSHNVYDGGLLLGVCDKIVPGLLIGALQFGHLPFCFVPAGPMPSGLSNSEKSRVRQQYAQGLVSRETLLEAERAAYHGEGTCTFYGTANSNQLLLEFMGLQLSGSSFVPPGTALRDALTAKAVEQLVAVIRAKRPEGAIGHLVNEKTIVNAAVGLLASGGSTNHTIHLVAIARSAGILLTWDDFSALSDIVPLIAKVYPNGSADINHFHAAGGTPFMMRSLLQQGLLHDDVETILGPGLTDFCCEPQLDGARLQWRQPPLVSAEPSILRDALDPFETTGGIRCLSGNLGTAVSKVSAVDPSAYRVVAPAVVVDSQRALQDLFDAGRLDRDFVAVVRFQGPKANGMPELHKLTTILSVLQDRGHRVALVTDGRMSGASGKIPAAIHVTPEAQDQGPISKILDEDLIELDLLGGVLRIVDETSVWSDRPAANAPAQALTFGRGLFGFFRDQISGADSGATPFGLPYDSKR